MRIAQTGLSLVELMISITVSMILSLAALSLYASQMRNFSVSEKRENSEQETRNTVNQLANLLRQAVICTSPQCTPVTPLSVTYSSGMRNGNILRTIGKSVEIDLVVPAAYPIWPNDAAPYSNNAIRIAWSVASGKIQVSTAPNLAGLPTAVPVVIAGNANFRLINLDLWPIQADGITPALSTVCDAVTNTGCPYGGYELSLTTRIGNLDPTYINPLDPTNAQGLQNYRTATYTTRVFPRN